MLEEKFNIPEELFCDCVDFVKSKPSEHVLIFQPKGFHGELKTLLLPNTGTLIFTYNGEDKVLLNDVSVLSGAYQVLQQSGVLKGNKGNPIYYSSIFTNRIIINYLSNFRID